MDKQRINVKIELLSETIFASGHSTPGGEDISIRKDHRGRPFLPGSTLKGLLLERTTDLLVWEGCPNAEAMIDRLFGREGIHDDTGRLGFAPLYAEREDWETLRAFTGIENGIVAPQSLRVASCLKRGVTFSGPVFCDKEDTELICRSLSCIDWAGLHRNRGFGRIQVQAEAIQSPATVEATGTGSYLYYRIRLDAPLTVGYLNGSSRAADKSNYIDTRTCLPGSVLRGFVATELAHKNPQWFEDHKKELLSDCLRFTNAFPVLGGKSTIPTPSGFYSDKPEKVFYSIFERDVEAGEKRARLGSYCVPEGPVLATGTPGLTDIMRINRKKNGIFTTTAIAAGEIFEGYLHSDNQEVLQEAAKTLRDWIWLGADRYAGSGLCAIEELRYEENPYWFRWSASDTPKEQLYLLLLSPMTMCKNGEIVGIDEGELARLLQVETVRITRCATSITEVRGFNRTWGCDTPVLPMYEAGSVFQLHCEPAPSKEAMRRLEMDGLGLRRAEGFGSVLFIQDPEFFTRHSALKPDVHKDQPQSSKLRQAKIKWLFENVKKIPSGISKSMLGNIQALAEQARFNGGCLDDLWQYFQEKKKTVEPEIVSQFTQLNTLLSEILSTQLAHTLGVDFDIPDGNNQRLDLVIELLDLNRKEDVPC